MKAIDKLVEIIRSHNEFNEAKPRFVSIYRRHQCYGGPEEGGWWHTRNILEGSIPFPTEEAAEQWLEEAKRQVEEQNRAEAPDRHRAMASLPDYESAYYDEGYIPTGWDDGGELWVTIEETAGISDNRNEPIGHYE